MTDIIPLNPEHLLPLLMEAAQKIVDKYGGLRSGEGEPNWMIHCPIHDDNQASCHLKVSDRLLVFCHVCGKDKQQELIDKLKEDGLWPNIVTPKKDRPDVTKSIIPSPDVPAIFPEYIKDKKGKYRKITKSWTYFTDTSHPAFWVLRADWEDEVGVKHKEVKPFSCFPKEDGNGYDFKVALACDERPLYNLLSVTRSNRSVIVVEGEKTADAALELFPDYSVVTWAMGASSLTKTDFAPLLDKDVVLWPDNDKPGIKAMLQLAQSLPKARIVFQEVQEGLPIGWDLADPCPENISLLQLVNLARLPTPAPIDEQWTLEALKEKWQKVESNGRIDYYDTTSRSFSRRPEQPFRFFSSKLMLQEYLPEIEINLIDGKPRAVKKIDKYLEDSSQQLAVGLICDPTTTNVRVWKNDSLYLNTYMGFEHEPIECDSELYQPFLTHLNGCLNAEAAEYMLNYFSDLFQNTARKPGVMPILTGKPGTGKSIIGEVISCILGRRIADCIACGAVFDSKFNGQLANKIFVCLDELNLYGAANKHANETLKVLVTDHYISVNAKYQNQRSEQSYIHLIATTNVLQPLLIDVSDRRYPVFKVNDTFLRDYKHFEKIVSMMRDPVVLSGLAYYFMNRKITGSIFHIPQTEERITAQKPEDPIMAFLFTWLNEGHLPEEITGRLQRCHWPEESQFIHRFLVNDYIIKKHPSMSQHRISIELLKHLKWDHPNGKYNNTKRLMVTTPDGRGITELNKSVYKFQSLKIQRQIYEEVTGTKPSWTDITFDDSDPDDNIAPF